MDGAPAGIERRAAVARALRAWRKADPELREEWEARSPASRRPGGSRRCRRSRPGRGWRPATRGKKVMQAISRLTPTMVGRRGGPRRVDEDRVRGRPDSFSATHAGRNIAFGHPRARDGLDRERDLATRRHAEAVRLDLPDLLRLHAPGRPARRARPHAVICGSGRTTRSASARTARPTSRSSTAWRSASIPQPLVMRPGDANETSVAWRIALEREGGPVALALSRQKLPTLDRSERRAGGGRASRRLRALAVGDGSRRRS